MKNNVHDKIFVCPKCHNKTLVPVKEPDIIGIGYGDLCICEECGAELKAKDNYDFTVDFFEDEEED
jgi:transcription elongation factor Elf1